MSVREERGQPPDFPDQQVLGFIFWEPKPTVPKASVSVNQVRRAILNEGVLARPDRSDPWPGLGIIAVNLTACLGSAGRLKRFASQHEARSPLGG